jgi:3-deoxy-D-arabino-heptulosonate 7-phosphate (DAHP) synthase class II
MPCIGTERGQTAESLKLNDRRLRVPDESRMVKAYQRSAAGMETELVSDIRSPATCLVRSPFAPYKLYL